MGEIDFMHHFALTNFGPDLGPYLSLNKAVVFMFLAAGIVLVTFSYAGQNLRLVPGRLQTTLEGFVVFVRDDICISMIGHGGEKFLPFVLSLFAFVFTCNFLGIVPFGYTATSNVNVTGTLAIMVFGLGLFLGFKHRGPIGFFTGLVPSGLPGGVGGAALKLLLFVIELISLFAKHFALAIRLFANMFAGHIVLLVFAAITATLLGTGVVAALFSPVPFALIAVMTVFEMFVALIQAFIFAVLTALYIGEAVSSH